ncbi:MAG: hypothetical protein ABH879_10140 [archaeon]
MKFLNKTIIGLTVVLIAIAAANAALPAPGGGGGGLPGGGTGSSDCSNCIRNRLCDKACEGVADSCPFGRVDPDCDGYPAFGTLQRIFEDNA